MDFQVSAEKMNLQFTEHVFRSLGPHQLYDLARRTPRLFNICKAIWRSIPEHLDAIHFRVNKDISFVDYSFYLCTMTEHLTSMIIYTNDISNVSAACKKHKDLPNIKEIEIYNYLKPKELPAVFDLFIRFSSLHTLKCCEDTLRAYFGDIMQLKTLKTLKVFRMTEEYDNLTEQIINLHGNRLKKLQTPVQVFPPSWLTTSNMSTCGDLQELEIQTHFSKRSNIWRMYELYPILPELHTLKIIGKNFCQLQLMKFIDRCPKLGHITFYAVDLNVEYLNDINCMRLNQQKMPIKFELKGECCPENNFDILERFIELNRHINFYFH